ncbi:hypothetical protein E2C01_102830 [Portunus trituberculatus]|uniref:Uncharacterized protein n=1 Tax=Portunus trituberculatus TaxID=210409 RepID=A0A5B7KIG2_PORTR|nr:hypothetical protein [Portunus trituberculatus]
MQVPIGLNRVMSPVAFASFFLHSFSPFLQTETWLLLESHPGALTGPGTSAGLHMSNTPPSKNVRTYEKLQQTTRP